MKKKESSISEKQRQLKKEFRQSVFIIVVVICVMVAATIAWFVNNTTVGIETFPIWSNYQSRFEVKVGNEETSLDKQTIECVLRDLVYESQGDEKKDYIGPGAKGKLEIHIIPHDDDVDTVKVKLSMHALGQDKVEISDETMKKLIQGHLLLFHEQDTESIGFYQDLILLDDNQEVEFTIELDKDDQGYTKNTVKNIYWVWPVKFDDYITYGEGSLFQSKEDMDNIINHINAVEGKETMKKNYKKYFYNQDDSDLNKLEEYMVKPLKEMGSEKNEFREYYNNADQYIGEKVTSLAIDLSIWE